MRTFLFSILILLLCQNTVLSQTKGMKTVVSGTERRLALVIGNKDYATFGTLKNPLNDADDVSKAFQQLGFEVTTVTNADYKKMLNAFNVFTKNLLPNDVVAFYYSGHGLSYGGKNYLVPVDAAISCLEEIEENAVTLGRLMVSIEAKSVKNSFVFLDACRNLPALKQCTTGTKDITITKGLVRPTNNPNGSMTVYATREGYTADDNSTGRNGLFTSELLKYLTVPNLGLRQILDRTKKGVEQLSNNRQSPARYDELSDDFYFLVSDDTPPKREEPAKPKAKVFMDLPFAEMAYVEGGTFQMGDEEGYSREKPVHSVTVSSFYMSKYEITQRQWESVMGSNPSSFKDCADCPVENVSWEDIQEFLKKLNARTGGKYRLPTEAEWEYAAGGGSGTRTRFGNGRDVLDAGEANFDARAAYKSLSTVGEYREKTLKVGSFQPNGLGLYDLSGNVWEWCSDWYGDYSSSASINPTGSTTGSARVLRGGSWYDQPADGRVAYRRNNTPSFLGSHIGFRVVSRK